MYTPAILAKYATEHRNTVNHNSTLRHLPLALAQIVDQYSCIDPRIPESIHDPITFGSMTFQMDIDGEGHWNIDFVSDAHAIEISAVHVTGINQIDFARTYSMRFGDFCSFLLDGEICAVCDEYGIPADDPEIKLIDRLRDSIYQTIIDRLPNPNKN